jgi:hypothetical protein
MDLEKLAEDVKAVFTGAEKVEVRKYNDNIHVEVSRMYEFLPLTFDILMKLSELFGTRDFAVNNWSAGGCETCDYGSKYTHEFSFKEVN